jgi:hypothetical protein
MAIAFDATSESSTGTTGVSGVATYSWTHTPVGTPRGVVVFTINMDSPTGITSGVTYGGVALTQSTNGFASDTATETGRCTIWFLGSGIPTGAQTIVVSRTNNANVTYAVAATVTAATTTTELYEPGIVTDNEDGTLAERGVDDGSPGTNSLRFGGGMSGLASVPSAGASSTVMNGLDIGNQVAQTVRETTAGQGVRNVGMSSATSDDRAMVYFAVREPPPPPPVVPVIMQPYRAVLPNMWG